MVDNRSAGFYGIGGAFNFKSGDPSGTAAKMSQDKYGSEAMYLPPIEGEEESENLYENEFVDRSALLRATLNSLAMTNVASVINSRKHKKDIKDIVVEEKNDDEDDSKDNTSKDNDKEKQNNSKDK